MMKKIAGLCLLALVAFAFCWCVNRVEKGVPDADENTEQESKGELHRYKAPLYWSVYEYCWMLEKASVPTSEMDITEEQWDKIIDWVATDLKPYGYDMVCTDGFIPMLVKDDSGYMTHYGSMSLKKLVEKCKARGLKVGVYDNPLWIHGADDTVIEGTDGITFGDYIRLENYYQGYLMSHDDRAVDAMVAILYPGLDTSHLDPCIRYGTVLWMVSVKKLFARLFPDFLRPASPNADGTPPDMRAVMVAEIRALTGGDVTKNAAVLESDAWDALTELNEKAREAREFNEKMKK